MKALRLLALVALICLLPAMVLAETEIVTVTCLGDFLPGSNDKVRDTDYAFQRYIEKYGWEYPFLQLQGLMANDDITLVNLECPLNDDLPDSTSRFCFRGPTEYAKILSASSVEVVNLANNHMDNYGKAGYKSTTDALDAEGILYCGSMEFGNDACFIDVKGVRIGFVGDYPLWRSEHPEDLEKCFQYLKDNGCDVIIASLHAGQEYRGTHGGIQENNGNILRKLGAHIVVGTHSHVPEGVRVTGGVTQLYSLGNSSFGGNTGVDEEIHCLQGVVAQFALYFEDGKYTGHQMTLWPIHISGTTPENNYQPVLVEGDAAQVVMKKMQKDTEFKLKPYVDGQGAVQDFVKWTGK